VDLNDLTNTIGEWLRKEGLAHARRRQYARLPDRPHDPNLVEN
jgi:hypothetical protein